MAQEEELQREKRLVAAMMAGDERAMEEFADRYIPPLYRFASARLRGDRELTRDIVQTTLCKALEKIAGFRGEASLASWLAACCRNEIRMHFRAAGRRPRLVELEAEARDARPARLGQPIPGPETRVLRDEKAEQVHAALDRLPPRYAAALEGKYVHRWSVRRVADELAITPKAAESLLGRARAAFRETYSRLVDSIVPLVEPASQRRSVR